MYSSSTQHSSPTLWQQRTRIPYYHTIIAACTPNRRCAGSQCAPVWASIYQALWAICAHLSAMVPAYISIWQSGRRGAQRETECGWRDRGRRTEKKDAVGCQKLGGGRSPAYLGREHRTCSKSIGRGALRRGGLSVLSSTRKPNYKINLELK